MESETSIQEIREILKELANSQKETERRFNETDKKIKEAFDMFTSQWGKLVESLVEGDLVRLLNQWGIPVQQTTTRLKGHYKGRNYEFDIIAINGSEIVFVEVKTTLRPNDVKYFKEKLKEVKTWLPHFASNTVYGAVAFLQAHAGAERMAENEGLFVIKATGSSASIANTPGFSPRSF